MEVLQVGKSADGNFTGDVLELFIGLLNPWMVKCFLSRRSLLLLESQQLGDEVLTVVTDFLPTWVSE